MDRPFYVVLLIRTRKFYDSSKVSVSIQVFLETEKQAVKELKQYARYMSTDHDRYEVEVLPHASFDLGSLSGTKVGEATTRYYQGEI